LARPKRVLEFHGDRLHPHIGGARIGAAEPHEHLNVHCAVGLLDVDPIEVLVHRWIEALPQYAPGHGELTARIRAGMPPTLAIAGNYLDGVGVPACIGAAGRAAAVVVAATATN
jgi:hypothetical protein